MVHFIDDFPINTSIYKGFSMAMLNNQMITLPGKKNKKHVILAMQHPRRLSPQ